MQTMASGTMTAMVFEEYGGPEEFVARELPLPAPAEGEIRIKVRAFGINRAETHMRAGHWGDVARVTGIECVGEVDCDPAGSLQRGRTVTAITGGMGRWRNGSYAEYVCVPSANIFTLETMLPWAELAAIPESYATAWTCLFENLRLERGQVLFMRGATSALGQAAVNLAADAGATILASTRSEAKAPKLKELGAQHVLLENGALFEQIRRVYPNGVDAVLEIVGNSTLRDSLRMPKKGGRLCLVGFLGGDAAVDAFNPVLDMPSGVDFNLFVSALAYGTRDWPLSDVPLQQIVDKVAAGTYKAKPVKVYPFDEIADAHRLMESNQANGKIVVAI